jgi:hypothetical protein
VYIVHVVSVQEIFILFSCLFFTAEAPPRIVLVSHALKLTKLQDQSLTF